MREKSKRVGLANVTVHSRTNRDMTFDVQQWFSWCLVILT